MRILGIDICKSSVVCCLLESRPIEPRQFYFDAEFLKLPANVIGIKKLLELKPDIAVLEPTGTNYSKLWGTYLARNGIEVRLVGHNELKHYRKNTLQLPDKDDDADSLALACYGFDYLESPNRFLQIRDETIVRIRELCLRLAHLVRCQSPIINRLRQDLAWQFPEVAFASSKRSGKNVGVLWGWLAGIKPSPRLDNLYKKSIGLGIKGSAKKHAARICDIQREEIAIEIELEGLIADNKFLPYRKVFAKFGFGQRTEAILLSQIFPFENFLKDGKPEQKIRKGRKSGKPTKRHLSSRRFQKSLGAAPNLESSGDKSRSSIVGGSDICRKYLWLWIFTKVEPAKNRSSSEIIQTLGNFLDSEKSAGKPVKLVRSRTIAKAAKLLFKEMCREFCKD